MTDLKTQMQADLNKMYDHLVKQGKKSVNVHEGIGCAYRGRGGTMCAVGCLISDQAYSFKMEGKSGCQVALTV